MRATVALRAVVVVCSSLALSACLDPVTEDEATSTAESELEAASLAALGSCAGWSQWIWDGSSTTCGIRFACGTNCDEVGNCEVNPASYKQEYSYRVCFDQNGNYSHTEYQYRQGGFLLCGC